MEFLRAQNSALDLISGGNTNSSVSSASFKGEQSQTAKDFSKEYDRYDQNDRRANSTSSSQKSNEKPASSNANESQRANESNEKPAEETTDAKQDASESVDGKEKSELGETANASQHNAEEQAPEISIDPVHLLSTDLITKLELIEAQLPKLGAVGGFMQLLPGGLQHTIDFDKLLQVEQTHDELIDMSVLDKGKDLVVPGTIKNLTELPTQIVSPFMGLPGIDLEGLSPDSFAQLDLDELEIDLRPIMPTNAVRVEANASFTPLISGLGDIKDIIANFEAFDENSMPLSEGARFGDMRSDAVRPRLDFVAGLQQTGGVDAARQVVAAIRANATGGAIEVRLDPPELGQVKISFQMERTDIVAAVVNTEKTDTMDIMRRHADELTQALEMAGFGGVDLQFQSQGGDGQSSNNEDTRFGEQELWGGDSQIPGEIIYLSMRTDNRLDRLV